MNSDRVTQIKLPKLHINQYEVLKGLRRFNVVRCGRRWGKNILLEHIIVNMLLKSNKNVCYIEPINKM
jgi:hypothetical protein